MHAFNTDFAFVILSHPENGNTSNFTSNSYRHSQATTINVLSIVIILYSTSVLSILHFSKFLHFHCSSSLLNSLSFLNSVITIHIYFQITQQIYNNTRFCYTCLNIIVVMYLKLITLPLVIANYILWSLIHHHVAFFLYWTF